MDQYNIQTPEERTSALISQLDTDIQTSVDLFISNNCQDEMEVHDKFNQLLLYVHNTCIRKKDSFQCELLPVYEYLFQVYTSLCIQYGVLPSLGIYCMFAGINLSSAYRAIGMKRGGNVGQVNNLDLQRFMTNVTDFCQAMTIDRLHNMRGSDANLIFISKAAYGLTETAPVQTIEYRQADSLEAIADSIGIDVTDG